jgi:integrase
MPGSIRKGKGKDTYYLEVFDRRDYKGDRIRYFKTITAANARDAKKQLEKFSVECTEGKIRRASNLKMNELIGLFLEQYAEPTMKVSTLNSVRGIIQRTIRPTFGKAKVASMKKIHIQSWVNDYRTNHSAKTVMNAYSLLRNMFNWANQMDLTDNNPCRDIILPRAQKKEATYFNKEDVAALLKALENVPKEKISYKTAIYLLLFSGIRKSELFGLNWSDVNMMTGELTIQRTRQIERQKYKIYEDVPKTYNSTRRVTVPSEVINLMLQLKEQQEGYQKILGGEWLNSDALLKGPVGQPMYPELLHRWFSRFLKEQGLKHISLHGLRHTHTAMLAYMNADKMLISKRLGHSQLSTTMNIYTHLFEEKNTIASELSEQFLKAPNPIQN